MAKKPNQPCNSIASGPPAEGCAQSIKTDADQRAPSAEADEAVLRLARLVGRQIAREQFVDKETTLPPSRRKKEAP